MVAEIILPPPAVRELIDKTADYVSRNGTAFERRIADRESTNTKFAFLSPGDPFNAYYVSRVAAATEEREALAKAGARPGGAKPPAPGVTAPPPATTAAPAAATAAAPAAARSGAASQGLDVAGPPTPAGAEVVGEVASRAALSGRAVAEVRRRRRKLGDPIADADAEADALIKADAAASVTNESFRDAILADSAAAAAGVVAARGPSATESKLEAQLGWLAAPTFFDAEPPTAIAAIDLDIIRLTARYAAVHGQYFEAGLAQRESRNPQFDFCKPQHPFFPMYRALVDAYGHIVDCGLRDGNDDDVGGDGDGAATGSGKSDTANPAAATADAESSAGPSRAKPGLEAVIAKLAGSKFEAGRAMLEAHVLDAMREARRRREAGEAAGAGLGEDELDIGTGTGAGGSWVVDWQDFAIVETIEFPLDGSTARPTAAGGGAGAGGGSSAAGGAAIGGDDDADMDIDMDVEMDMDESSSDSVHRAAVAAIGAANNTGAGGAGGGTGKRPAGKAAGRAAALAAGRVIALDDDDADGEEEEIEIVMEDYLQQAKAKAAAAAAAGAESRGACPICDKVMPLGEIAEHMRLELLDPQWKAQRDIMVNRAREAARITASTDVSANLRQFASHRQDLFDSSAGRAKFVAGPAPPSIAGPPVVLPPGTLATDTKPGITATAPTAQAGGAGARAPGTTGPPPLHHLKPAAVVAAAPAAAAGSVATTTSAAAGAGAAGAGAAGAPPAAAAAMPVAKPAAAVGVQMHPSRRGLIEPQQQPHQQHQQQHQQQQQPAAMTGIAMNSERARLLQQQHQQQHQQHAAPAAHQHPSAPPSHAPPPGQEPAHGVKRPREAAAPAAGAAAGPAAGLLSAEEFAAKHPGLSSVTVSLPDLPARALWKLDGRTVTVADLLPQTTMLAIKEKLSAQELGDMPHNKQKLMVTQTGTFVSDTDTIASLNLVDGAELALTVKERGGKKKK
jgi:splicing factor 3A subunit 1